MPQRDANRDYWIKQSEMLQSAIARMANNSLEIKKVGLTVWAAIVGFGFTTTNRYLFLLAFVAFALFGVLDLYYLDLERKFRDNFNRLTRIFSNLMERPNFSVSFPTRSNPGQICLI